MAEEQELDLVKISPNAVPPVCKIMDYRQVLLRPEEAGEGGQEKPAGGGDQGRSACPPASTPIDLNIKVKNAMKFLNDGNRVKVSVRFRGREMAHTNIGEKLLMDFAAACA